jgi:hypothetical protein
MYGENHYKSTGTYKGGGGKKHGGILENTGFRC